MINITYVRFTKNYKFDTIESFSDISLFDGKMFQIWGLSLCNKNKKECLAIDFFLNRPQTLVKNHVQKCYRFCKSG